MMQLMEELRGVVLSLEHFTGGGEGPRNPHVSAITQNIKFYSFESRTGWQAPIALSVTGLTDLSHSFRCANEALTMITAR